MKDSEYQRFSGSRRKLVDSSEPTPPFFLKADDLFEEKDGREIFIKKIQSVSQAIPKIGNVVLAPGLATNGNIYRIDDLGGFLRLDHSRNFANLLASKGFRVYIYHPGYTQRVHNRYVYQHCKKSRFYHRRYRIPSELDFNYLADVELPMVMDMVARDSGEPEINWVGYSMGGMLMYAYLSKNPDARVTNVVTIGSPVTLGQLFIRIIPYTNMASKALGFEESAFLGTISQNFVPLTRVIRRMPGSALLYNPVSFILWNPLNITSKVIKVMLGKIVEPIPHTLEHDFARMISEKINCGVYGPNTIKAMQEIRRNRTNFLFFFGENDLLATPDSVLLAHEILTPGNDKNLIGVPSAGHVDIMVGKNAMEKVWQPATRFLVEKTERRPKLCRISA